MEYLFTCGLVGAVMYVVIQSYSKKDPFTEVIKDDRGNDEFIGAHRVFWFIVTIIFVAAFCMWLWGNL